MVRDALVHERDASLRRCERAAARVRDLLERISFDSPQHPRGPLVRRDAFERAIEETELGDEIGWRSLCGELIEAGVRVGFFESEHPPQSAAAESAMHLTDGDLEQPSAQSLRLTESSDPFEQDYERIVQDVLALLPRSEKSLDGARDDGRKAAIEFRFGALIARDDTLYEVGVVSLFDGLRGNRQARGRASRGGAARGCDGDFGLGAAVGHTADLLRRQVHRDQPP
jgi:hypothetical protein